MCVPFTKIDAGAIRFLKFSNYYIIGFLRISYTTDFERLLFYSTWLGGFINSIGVITNLGSYQNASLLVPRGLNLSR